MNAKVFFFSLVLGREDNFNHTNKEKSLFKIEMKTFAFSYYRKEPNVFQLNLIGINSRY
jgi:hypothetical protein